MTKSYNTPIIPTNNELPRDLICFSHLRWNFVYQRPQHLLSRFAKTFRVFFIEEPVYSEASDNLQITLTVENVFVVIPQLQQGEHSYSNDERIFSLLSRLFRHLEINKYIFWYYTPMALSFSDKFKPELTIYDCMDELSAFKFAPPQLKTLEASLMKSANVVFTGGQSLFEAKKDLHPNIHPFPSSIDKDHFYRARLNTAEPADQQKIPHPRFGFYGVIDERMDIELIRKVAEEKPDWQFVIIGPVVKIDPASLPKKKNIHYLGSKSYNELPSYLGGWDIAFIPFALNESTKFISPTKTPEYLAAGKPVISTSIRDVVNPYGIQELVHIADTAEEFIKAATTELSTKEKNTWKRRTDEFLAEQSWDHTWKKMMDEIIKCFSTKEITTPTKTKEKLYV